MNNLENLFKNIKLESDGIATIEYRPNLIFSSIIVC
jgi:hypothetical protein